MPNITLINSLVLILLIYFGKTTMPNTTRTAAKAKPGQPKPVAKKNNKKDAAGSKRFHAKGKRSKRGSLKVMKKMIHLMM